MNLRRGLVFENSILREKAQHYKNHQKKIYTAKPTVDTGLQLRLRSMSQSQNSPKRPVFPAKWARSKSESSNRWAGGTQPKTLDTAKQILPGMAQHGREQVSSNKGSKKYLSGLGLHKANEKDKNSTNPSSAGGVSTFLTDVPAPAETKPKLERKSRSPVDQAIDRRQFHQREIKKQAEILLENRVDEDV